MPIHIGTSGWNYKHWREIFYPKGLAQSKWLPFFAERFETVEINTSFYRIPKAESIERWQQQTPEGFRFAVKLWRGITHYKKLKDSGEFLKRFFDVFESLQLSRRGPLLIQLPPNMGKNTDKLSRFLDDLRAEAPSPWRYAFEFRNEAWLSPDIYDLLDRAGAALCLHDMAGAAASTRANSAPLVYVRRHGTGHGKYSGSYSPGQLRQDAEQIMEWRRQGRDVFVYFNNDIGGHAIHNAIELRQQVIL